MRAGSRRDTLAVVAAALAIAAMAVVLVLVVIDTLHKDEPLGADWVLSLPTGGGAYLLVPVEDVDLIRYEYGDATVHVRGLTWVLPETMLRGVPGLTGIPATYKVFAGQEREATLYDYRR